MRRRRWTRALASATSAETTAPCTSNKCDPENGCVHPPAAGDCDDGDACTNKDACDGASFDVRVVDNTNDKSLYAIKSPAGFQAPVRVRVKTTWQTHGM